ncbi:MAG: hypothetical protein WA160_15050 [Pseudobdellovibrio sp.]
MKILFGVILFFSSSVFSETVPKAEFYRNLSMNVRKNAEFLIPFPGASSSITYNFDFDRPVYLEPILNDIHMGLAPKYFFRSFWDRILFKDGSYLLVNGEKLPLTCIFIVGQDNRFVDKKQYFPLLPETILKVYLVANDFSCQGPIKPGWPETGGKKENWDTYLYYEIKDPTIMLPVDATLRYRWNEFDVVLVDRGDK